MFDEKIHKHLNSQWIFLKNLDFSVNPSSYEREKGHWLMSFILFEFSIIKSDNDGFIKGKKLNDNRLKNRAWSNKCRIVDYVPIGSCLGFRVPLHFYIFIIICSFKDFHSCFWDLNFSRFKVKWYRWIFQLK